MKECINCGKKESSNNAAFCHFCGGELVQVEQALCKNCGVQIDPNFELCESCSEEINSDANSRDKNMYDAYGRDLMPAKSSGDKLVFVLLAISIVVCLLAAAVICVVVSLSNDDKQHSSDKQHSNNETSSAVVKTDEEPVTEPSQPVSEPEKEGLKNEAKQQAPTKPEASYEPTENMTRILYDYDPNNNDWYRIRKSRNDASSQIGAYKTAQKALSYAATYCPRGYTLYDKNFNPVDIYNYTIVDSPDTNNSSSNTNSSNSSNTYSNPPSTSNNSSGGLYDYDPNSNDWYRIRKSRGDASSQVGAYKTVEKAFYYADIYCPQGYTLYDKDFNVIR